MVLEILILVFGPFQMKALKAMMLNILIPLKRHAYSIGATWEWIQWRKWHSGYTFFFVALVDSSSFAILMNLSFEMVVI